MNWFEVDKGGLARLIEQRGKAFVLYELVQNAWDSPGVSSVKVTLSKRPGERVAMIAVEDDCPEGFANIRDAFTLFADSNKKGDPQKRGRFNLGEKLVLALCTEAEIYTTKGMLYFGSDGRREYKDRRESGSTFIGYIKMTNAEMQECIDAMHRLIVPQNITTTLVLDCFGTRDTVVLEPREPIAQVRASLPTEIADAEGVLRGVTRQTTISIYTPKGEFGMLYEMGIPVVETGDAFDVDIAQKVPLNFNRDNVSAAYLRSVRTHVVNAVHDRIDQDSANELWVRETLGDNRITPAAVKTIIQRRFGDKAVAYDPSDPESNKRAVAAGYNVVHGSQLSKPEWANVRSAGVLPPAGKVTPSPKAYSDDPNAPQVKIVQRGEWTEAQIWVVAAIQNLGEVLLGFSPAVRIVDTTNKIDAAYDNRTLDLNLHHLGNQWFDDCLASRQLTEAAISLLIHEFGHEHCGDHLSDDYYHALTRLGAKLAVYIATWGKNVIRVGTLI